MRNYLGELKSIGVSYKQIAAELGISTSKVSSIANLKTRVKSDTDLYAEIRNLHRNTISRQLQEQGFHGDFVSKNRRISFEDFERIPSELENLVEATYKKWNRSYIAYERNPKDWMKRNQWAKNPPKELSREEIERRIQKGASRATKLSDCKDTDATFRSP